MSDKREAEVVAEISLSLLEEKDKEIERLQGVLQKIFNELDKDDSPHTQDRCFFLAKEALKEGRE